MHHQRYAPEVAYKHRFFQGDEAAGMSRATSSGSNDCPTRDLNRHSVRFCEF